MWAYESSTFWDPDVRATTSGLTITCSTRKSLSSKYASRTVALCSKNEDLIWLDTAGRRLKERLWDNEPSTVQGSSQCLQIQVGSHLSFAWVVSTSVKHPRADGLVQRTKCQCQKAECPRLVGKRHRCSLLARTRGRTFLETRGQLYVRVCHQAC